jgi:hypothetical protein
MSPLRRGGEAALCRKRRAGDLSTRPDATWLTKGKRSAGSVWRVVRLPESGSVGLSQWATTNLEIGQCVILGSGLRPSMRQILRNTGHDHAPIPCAGSASFVTFCMPLRVCMANEMVSLTASVAWLFWQEVVSSSERQVSRRCVGGAP